MKIAMLTGSRADAGALAAVEHALIRAGHATQWVNIPAPMGGQDSRFYVANAAAMACGAMAKELQQNTPSLVFLHGDRYEVLGAATAAFLMGLPIAHLGGGDVTEGSQDDSIRHAITKLSHLHFATCEDSARRLVQLGEDPSRVHNVGDPGIDVFHTDERLPTREDTLRAVGLPLSVTRYFLVAYHPNTLGHTHNELEDLTCALKYILDTPNNNLGVVLLDPNKDADHLLIEQEFTKLAGRSPRVRYCPQLHRNLFLGLMKHTEALVGNSSAAYYEAPSLGTLVINMGHRQIGRKRGANWLATCHDMGGLMDALTTALTMQKPVKAENPYGDGQASDRIASIINKIKKPATLLNKSFYNVPSEDACLTQFGNRYTPAELGGATPRRNWYDGSPATTSVPTNGQLSGSWISDAVRGQALGSSNKKGSQ